jgi:lipopolysaccharide transport system permease protein
LILNHANFVKKVVFPLEILPWVTVGAALFHTVISLCVWTLAYVCVLGWPQPTLILLPCILLPFACLLVGLSWMLASLGVYLRDVTQVVTLGVSSLMFISPIFYPVASLPESIRPLLYANPLTPVIEWTRQVMYWGEVPQAFTFFGFAFACCITCWMGFFWFQKTRKGFADVV